VSVKIASEACLFSDEFTPRLENAFQVARAALLAERQPGGFWVGELSSSALSTATAVSALALVQKHADSRDSHADLIAAGLAWLAKEQNADGGWGDTTKSISNISTTMLGRAAIHIAGAADCYADCLERAETYLHKHAGKTPAEQAEAIRRRYGKDRTFAVPILTTSALAGLTSWREVSSLPFELACFPQSWFAFLRLPVVSYALPALIAIGQAVFVHRTPWNPLIRLMRHLARNKSLRVLETILPSSGGYLEAIPLTSFVTLSLASIGLADHKVARKGVEFLVNAVRPDGSWAIDSDLATWVTTLSINALDAAGELDQLDQLTELQGWLTRQQFATRHPFTGAEPGGFSWTPLPGGLPDADDTPGALIALCHLKCCQSPDRGSCSSTWQGWKSGRDWLLGLQNRDGGWPTFCRGWGALPFDRSGTDLTAHALRALRVLSQTQETDENAVKRCATATAAGLAFLSRHQRPDGSWLPLWFGNQYVTNDDNPAYGTARVLAAYRDLGLLAVEPARRAIAWLLANQNADGGWGGALGAPSSIEETALVVEVLIGAGPIAGAAVNKGLACLVQHVEEKRLYQPTPIGFYFAKLWYFEKLYPMIFTVAALGRARKQQESHCNPELCSD
jgi:squalene-hopene/tetraprenyl-beta-curcumene cyclase